MAEKTSSRSSSFMIDETDDEMTPLMEKKSKSLTWRIASLFVLGEIIGGGTIAMPDGLANIGWPGVLFICYLCLINIYTAIIQYKCMILLSKTPSFQTKSRSPYTAMVQYAFGKTGRIIGSSSLNLTSVIVCTIYLLTSSELTIKLLTELFPRLKLIISARMWILIFACFLIPLTFFGTPKDFWGVAVSAVLCTGIGIACILITVYLHIPNMKKELPQRTVTPATFFAGIGAIFFGFNVIIFLPNIHVDMQDKRKFSKSIYFSFASSFAVYLILSVSGFAVLGGDLKPNIIFNMLDFSKKTPGPIGYLQRTVTYIGMISFAGHFVLAYVLVFNNVAQEMEEWFQISRDFCWQRCIIRTFLVLLTLLIGESIPQFQIILSFSGGLLTTISIYTIIATHWKTMYSDISLLTKIISVLIAVTVGCAFIGICYSTIIQLVLLYK